MGQPSGSSQRGTNTGVGPGGRSPWDHGGQRPMAALSLEPGGAWGRSSSRHEEMTPSPYCPPRSGP